MLKYAPSVLIVIEASQLFFLVNTTTPTIYFDSVNTQGAVIYDVICMNTDIICMNDVPCRKKV